MRPRWLISSLSALAIVAVAGGAFFAVRYAAECELAILSEVEEARRERSEQRPGASVRRLSRLHQTQPMRDDVLYELGLSELARGKVDEAVDALEKVPARSPFAAKAGVTRAHLEIQRGRFSNAELALTGLLDRSLSTTASANQDRQALRDALVRLLRSEGRFAEARGVFLQGFEEWADPIEALRALYRLDVDPFPVEGVRTYLKNAREKSPKDDRAWLGSASLATRLGHFEDAERQLDSCLTRRPEDMAVWRCRLEWARAADRPDEALAAIRHLPADPYEAEGLNAWFAAKRGDDKAEQAALIHRLALHPGCTESLTRLAELEQRGGHAEAAARYRLQQDEVSRSRARYRMLLVSPDAKNQAFQLAKLAESLGMTFESDCWTSIARQSPRVPRPQSDQGRTLADLVTESPGTDRVDKARPGSAFPPSKRVWFVDIAESAGLSFLHDNGASADSRRLTPPVSASGGVGLLDFDGDGRLDVYCVQGGTFPPDSSKVGGDRLYRNKGNGTFEDVTKASGLESLVRGYGHGVAVGDFDGDGDPDLFVTRWRSYVLLRNRGDGTFEDATGSAGLGGERDWPTSAAFADLDSDGDLDLYVCHYLKWDETDTRTCSDRKDPAKYNCNPLSFEALSDHAFRNDNGRFVDVTKEAGLSEHEGRGLGVVAADLDGDHKIDLFVANDMSANFLYKNLGGFRFEEAATASGVAANAGGGYQAGMGVACGDLDGDGRPDLVVTNYFNESTTFFRNLGGGSFGDHTTIVGLSAASRFLLGFGVALPDVNNDGRLDLISANGHIHDGRPLFPYKMPVQLCLGDDRGRLMDVAASAGPALLETHIGRGLATGDLDNDGKLDAVMLSQNEPLVYLHNESEEVGHFVTLRLEGKASNRDAVGAEVTVRAGGHVMVAQRVGGGSYQSAGDPRLHFGLGDTTVIESVEIRWPSGNIDRHGRLSANLGYLIVEGEPSPIPLSGFKAGTGETQTRRNPPVEKEARP